MLSSMLFRGSISLFFLFVIGHPPGLTLTKVQRIKSSAATGREYNQKKDNTLIHLHTHRAIDISLWAVEDRQELRLSEKLKSRSCVQIFCTFDTNDFFSLLDLAFFADFVRFCVSLFGYVVKFNFCLATSRTLMPG